MPAVPESHGAAAARRYGAGGARKEAALGFPSVYGVAIPAPVRSGASSQEGMRKLLECTHAWLCSRAVGDTNLLHRGGLDGLAFAQCAAGAFLAAGGVGQPEWRRKALRIHRLFVARNLSPGGCADLLAMALFAHALGSGTGGMIALLCSGQGTQHREMFRLSGEAAGASSIFAAAERVLGVDPRDFVALATDSAMHANRAAQVLCVTQALAARALLTHTIPDRHIVAGYSVGEVAAWGVGGLLGPDQAIELASVRAEIMSRASNVGDGLASVRGLRYETVERLAHEMQAKIAIVNPNDTFVVGGSEAAVRNFCEAALAAGARHAASLPVHRSFAYSTARRSRRASPGGDSGTSSGRSAGRRTPPQRTRWGCRLRAETGADALARAIGTRLHWSNCLDAALERGASLFVELGPGRALAEMASAAHPHVPARSLDDFRSRAGLLSWIGRGRRQAALISADPGRHRRYLPRGRPLTLSIILSIIIVRRLTVFAARRRILGADRAISMKKSVERILTTHVGSLPRSADLLSLLDALEKRQRVDRAEFRREVGASLAAIIRSQADAGIDVASDGELPRIGFSMYVKDRMSGFGGVAKRGTVTDFAKIPGLCGPDVEAHEHQRFRVGVCRADARVHRPRSSMTRP